MSGITWTKFYWSDWLSDPALRRCSYAARGLWMDMLCIAATHDPIGVVAVAGEGLGPADLARMTGGRPNEVAKLLAELERSNVFSRDEEGRIFSRRMIADKEKIEAARAFGKEGGNPKLKGGYTAAGFVYLIGQRADGAFKVGISISPKNRLGKIQQQYPKDGLRLLQTWPVANMGAAEERVAERFRSKRDGEWYALTETEMEDLAGLMAPLNHTLKGGVQTPLKAHIPETRSQNSSEDKSSASDVLNPDLDAEAWGQAVKLLAGQGRQAEATSRKFFGKLLATNGLMARDMLPAITAARVNKTEEPQAYLSQSAKGIATRRKPQAETRVDWV